MSSLKERTASGIKWQVINKFSQKFISVATFAVLARIMEPAIFGLFALAFVVIDSLQFFKSFGLDSAVIQRKEDESFKRSLDTAFIVIQLNGLILCALCFFIAPWASRYFNNPELLNITRALGFIFIFTCFSKIPTTILQKRMRFNAIAIIEFISAILNSIVAISLAVTTKSVWSLVIAYLVKQTFISVVSWYCSGFRFTWQFDFKVAKELFSFGKYLMGMSVLWFISGKLNNIVVGKMLGVSLLGFLVLAENIGNFINTHFTSIISGVMFPAYASIQHDKEALKRAYLKTVKYVSFFSAPFSVFLMCFAEQFTHILYGDKWLAIIPLIQLFGLIQLISPILWCSSAVYMGCGKPNYSFNVKATQIALRIPLLIVFIGFWGLEGAVFSNVIITLIYAPVNLVLIKKIIPFKYKEFFGVLTSAYVCAGACFLLIVGAKIGMDHYISAAWLHFPIVQLTLLGLLGVGSYLLCAWKTDRTALLDMKEMILKRKKIVTAS